MADRERLADTLREMILAIVLTRNVALADASRLAVQIVDEAIRAADHILERSPRQSVAR